MAYSRFSSSSVSSSSSGSSATSPQSVEQVGPKIPSHGAGIQPADEIKPVEVDPEEVRDNPLEIESEVAALEPNESYHAWYISGSCHGRVPRDWWYFIATPTAEARTEGTTSGSQQISAPPEAVPEPTPKLLEATQGSPPRALTPEVVAIATSSSKSAEAEPGQKESDGEPSTPKKRKRKHKHKSKDSRSSKLSKKIKSRSSNKAKKKA
ncbi:hypothetical protein Salat_1670300 [Sesamum alatum]|uniref:Uncharacterized protein n=1 Tax=Sesamum alatum TaxID=300844 RepID=A0AAE1Y7G3_9LAMI|nr:hypothetical protein Salat_1670300 [Sesamum alatum]